MNPRRMHEDHAAFVILKPFNPGVGDRAMGD